MLVMIPEAGDGNFIFSSNEISTAIVFLSRFENNKIFHMNNHQLLDNSSTIIQLM